VPTLLTTIRHPKVIRALSTTNRSNGDWKARVQIRDDGNSRELLNSTTSRDIGTVAGSMLVFGGGGELNGYRPAPCEALLVSVELDGFLRNGG
jgi:hypothetical protein